MSQGIKDFMAGKIGTAEITEIIENAYRDLLAYNISLGRTDGTDPHYNARLLFNTQGHFAWTARSEALLANNAEGYAYAQENFGLNPGDRFDYYNAKYFFLNKELQEIGTAAIAQIALNEGFDFYDVQGCINYYGSIRCFSAQWQVGAMSARMKNTDIEPPKDFVMFFTPQLFSKEAFDSGSYQIISASDPSRPDGSNDTSFYMWVPNGKSLFKSLPFWLTQGNFTNDEGKSFVTWDVSKHLNFSSGKDVLSLMQKFFAEYVNDFNKGALSVWSNGTKSVHDVPFDIFFDEKRMFHGSELNAAAKHNDFVSNFEFRMF
jgi:hypothetical protein